MSNILHSDKAPHDIPTQVESDNSEFLVDDNSQHKEDNIIGGSFGVIWNWVCFNKKWIIIILLVISIVFLFYMNQSGYFIGSFPTRSDLGGDSESKFNLQREIEALNQRQSVNFKE